jgi:phytoene synthase
MNASLLDQATQTIDVGSKSFAAAARLFDRTTRQSVAMLYLWCRHCDDVVDGQVLGHRARVEDPRAPAERLAELRRLTRAAYAGEPMTEPPFRALQSVVRRHAIPERLPLQHLAGFAMDVEGRWYRTIDDTLVYCYHVAGVVGIMMAKVMGVHDDEVLDHACDLGIAFQLTNVVRDIVEDAELGRIYLPAEWLAAEAVPAAGLTAPDHREGVARVAARMLELAERYYESAACGISALPLRCAWAIATALGVYRSIGRSVLARGARAWDTRTVTSRIEKMRHAASGGALAMASRFSEPRSRPRSLWRRPA